MYLEVKATGAVELVRFQHATKASDALFRLVQRDAPHVDRTRLQGRRLRWLGPYFGFHRTNPVKRLLRPSSTERKLLRRSRGLCYLLHVPPNIPQFLAKAFQHITGFRRVVQCRELATDSSASPRA